LHPVLFQVHGLVFNSYGIILVLGLLAALGWLRRQPSVPDEIKAGFPSFVLVMAAGAFLGTLAEGFLTHLAQGGSARSVPWALLLRRGGSVQVALLGGALALAWRLKRPSTFLGLADLLAPAAALFQGIARIGCFMAGCCYGRPSGAPWAVTFTDPRARLWAGTPLGVPLAPVQLAYSAANFLIFLGLRRFLGRTRRPGSVLGWWLVLEGLQRIVLDTWRWDPGPALGWGWPWLTENRLISLVFIVAGAGWLAGRPRRLRAKVAPGREEA
jgi:phosphatidylglycerol:prolipoprotein diacylglycerol transferase